MLRRRPYLFLVPSASTGHQESIIRKKGNGVCVKEPVLLLCLGAQCLRGCREGALAPSACARAHPILLIFIRQRVRMQEQQKRKREGGNQLTSIFLFLHMRCQNLTARVRSGQSLPCRLSRPPCRTRICWTKGRAGRIKSKEGGVIIFFSFFFGCVPVDVRILTAHAQAKAPARSQGGQNSPFSSLNSGAPTRFNLV